MIFVTVGSQLSFDRLVRTVDEWAGARGRADVFAQIGDTAYRPEHIRWVAQLSPDEFRRRVQDADAVVAHAGMGTILTALEVGTPVLVLPRRADLRETRNDHQVATAQQLSSQGRIAVAFDEAELRRKLDDVDSLQGADRIRSQASSELLVAIRDFIEGSTRSPSSASHRATGETSNERRNH